MIAHKISAADTLYKGAKKIAHSWNVQFKFAPTRTRMTAVCLAVGAVFAGAFELTVWAQALVRL
jgi:hypothetical protein